MSMAPSPTADKKPGQPALRERLAAPGLAALRALCWPVGALALLLAVMDLPVYWAQLHTLCGQAECAAEQPSAGMQRWLVGLGLSLDAYAGVMLLLSLSFILSCFTVAALIFRRKASDAAALVTVLVLLLASASIAGDMDALAAQPGWAVPVNLMGSLEGVVLFLFLAVFPDGRFVPRWIGLGVLAMLLLELVAALFPQWTHSLGWTWYALAVVFVAAQVHRYRQHSTVVQRQQTKWAVLGISTTLLITVGLFVLKAAFPALEEQVAAYGLGVRVGAGASLLLIPLSLGIAVLRYRLWDIDLLVSRSLVYLGLTGSITGLYVLVVAGLSALSEGAAGPWTALPATILVAVLFQPLRAVFQRAANRLVYGERDDPYGVIVRLGQRLEAALDPDAVPHAIVETVARSLKLPYVALAFEEHDRARVAAAQGTPVDGVLQLPLVYQQEQVGALLLASRTPEDPFSPADLRLLSDLARQAGVAVHAVRLAADLQQSRLRLVTAREEERRRIRRDLHDGLGPALAALNLRAGRIRSRLPPQDAEARVMVDEWRAALKGAIADVRRLVYQLRPPALDELGLVGAIQESAARYGLAREALGMEAPYQCVDIHVDASGPVEQLPAALEVAAYRIAEEALANVVRHARARHCHVLLAADTYTLRLEIADDGVGLPDRHHSGVGLASMRERTSELGGTIRLEANPTGRGTIVQVAIPIPRAGSVKPVARPLSPPAFGSIAEEEA